LEVLKTAQTLRPVIAHLYERGFTTADSMMEVCTAIKKDVPVLSRVPALRNRIERALAMMTGGEDAAS
jgi:hypothetical protein